MASERKRLAVVAHVLTTVPYEDLKKHLLARGGRRLVFITHPLRYDAAAESRLEVYDGAAPPLVCQVSRRYGLGRHFIDAALTMYWLLRHGWGTDVVAFNPLNATLALMLRAIGAVRRVAYYCMDYVPKRFSFGALNACYHHLETSAAHRADATWDVSQRISQARAAANPDTAFPRVETLPIGTWFSEVPRRKAAPPQRPFHLVYAGGLMAHQGIDHSLRALALLQKSGVEAALTVIGLGPEEKSLKALAQSLGIQNQVRFLGYLKNHDDVARSLSEADLGHALYDGARDEWSRFGDPSKIKSYLAAGLPVVTTGVTHMAADAPIWGAVCEANPESAAAATRRLLEDPVLWSRCREGALRTAQTADWPVIFERGLRVFES